MLNNTPGWNETIEIERDVRGSGGGVWKCGRWMRIVELAGLCCKQKAGSPGNRLLSICYPAHHPCTHSPNLKHITT